MQSKHTAMLITVILLAAGKSNRFGENKLIAKLANGHTVIEQSLRIYQAHSLPMLVVTRPNDLELKKILEFSNIPWVECHNSEYGMGASIRCGIQSRIRSDGWLIALADMPLIKQSTIEVLIAKIDAGSMIVAPEFNGKMGHPVGFGKAMQYELLNLSPEFGAKSILSNHDELIDITSVDDPGTIIDIDTKRDMQQIKPLPNINSWS